MASHRQSRTIALPTAQLFDLIADVERYPEFLPLWRGARIVRHDDDGYETEQTVGFGPFLQRFVTRTQLDRPREITVTSTDATFDRFEIRWRLTPRDEGTCAVDFTLDCDVHTPWLRPYVEMMMAPTAATMVDAFQARAREIARAQEAAESRAAA